MTAPLPIPASRTALGLVSGNALSADFSTWTYQDAVRALQILIDDTVGESGFDSNRAFVEEQDHWQDGDTWVGPDGGSDLAVRSRTLAAVERQFTPVDVINEVLDNVANSLLKREPSVTFAPLEPAGKDGAPSDEQKKITDAMAAAITAWWDRVKLWKHARTAMRRSRWATRGALRVWIPKKALIRSEGQDPRLPSGLAFNDALKRVHVVSPPPDECGIYTDPDTQERAAIFLFRTDDAQNGAEIWFLDGDGRAHVRILIQDKEATQYAIDLKARLPINEMENELLITEPVRRQQNRLNFFESLVVRTGETAGFPERYTMNAMPQGVWMEDPPTDSPALAEQEMGGKTWYLHAVPRTLGASITTDLRGITITDKEGKESIASPSVAFREPTDPQFAVTACEHGRNTILRSCKQGHLTSESTAQTSGFAYQQARARFEDDLDTSRGPLEGLLRDTLETVIALASLMSTEFAEFLDAYRCVVNVHINAGPIAPDERMQNREDYKENLISAETAMSRNGIEDSVAERALIEADRNAAAGMIVKQATAIKTLTDAGASIDGAAQFVGIDPKQAALLLSGDGGNQNKNQPPVTQ